MQSDTDFINRIIDYIYRTPGAKAIDIVDHFESLGIPREKTLYTLKEIFN